MQRSPHEFLPQIGLYEIPITRRRGIGYVSLERQSACVLDHSVEEIDLEVFSLVIPHEEGTTVIKRIGNITCSEASRWQCGVRAISNIRADEVHTDGFDAIVEVS